MSTRADKGTRKRRTTKPKEHGEIVIPTADVKKREVKKLTEEGCSQFENYEIVVLHRSKIKNAPYNPRTITDDAKKKIKKNLKERGLMTPPIWNVRTGNLVGGHQRVSVMDALEGKRDYSLRVAKVDIDEITEREQNVFLNNTEAQGEFDIDKLSEVMRFDDLELENTGFDLGTAMQLLGDSTIIQSPEKLLSISNKLREIGNVGQNIDNLRKLGDFNNNRDDASYYLVVVFRDNKDREEFLTSLSLPNEKYVDVRVLKAKVLKEKDDE